MGAAMIDAATVWQERRLGRTIVKTRRAIVDLDDILPNDKQPRIGPKEDPELQRQIEANEGIFEPLLLEPHPTLGDKFRIIDGDRRWSPRSPTTRSRMRSGCGSGSTSTASARSGTPRRRRWSRAGWSSWSAAPAPLTSWASRCARSTSWSTSSGSPSGSRTSATRARRSRGRARSTASTRTCCRPACSTRSSRRSTAS
ncbi:MAG: hypothetical protein E6J90_28020 [Deltaproteobacteria bacterium]|nr:MAG: hypothetical protein E6J90_28020 [Deltaproteobacteria bacterium]